MVLAVKNIFEFFIYIYITISQKIPKECMQKNIFYSPLWASIVMTKKFNRKIGKK